MWSCFRYGSFQLTNRLPEFRQRDSTQLLLRNRIRVSMCAYVARAIRHATGETRTPSHPIENLSCRLFLFILLNSFQLASLHGQRLKLACIWRYFMCTLRFKYNKCMQKWSKKLQFNSIVVLIGILAFLCVAHTHSSCDNRNISCHMLPWR